MKNLNGQCAHDMGATLMSEESTTKWKNPLIFLNLGLNILIAVPLLWYLFAVPYQEMTDLKEGHVQVHIDDKKKASYEIVHQKPKQWVGLNEINKNAIHAIVVSEDWAFFQHDGYDVKQIREAVTDAYAGKRVRGASTISQQVAKNIFLSQEKSLIRKLKELVFSTTMERVLSKDKILETYLNVVEFGNGIYGIKAASEYYFKKHPGKLSPRESAFLAMLLPSPKRYAQSFRDKELTDFARSTIDEILEKMVQAKYLNQSELEKVKQDHFPWEEEDKPSNKVAKNSQGKKHHYRKTTSKGKMKGYESNRRVDSSLRLEENPEFDDDAIVEAVNGLDNEFSLE